MLTLSWKKKKTFDTCFPLSPQPGDRVYTNGSLTGSYAEYTLCSEDSVYALPDHLDFKGGAAIGIPYFTAYRALMQR